MQKKAVEIAKQIAESLDINGILAVEFFITQQDTLLVNETYKILIIKKYNAKKLCKKISELYLFFGDYLVINFQTAILF